MVYTFRMLYLLHSHTQRHTSDIHNMNVWYIDVKVCCVGMYVLRSIRRGEESERMASEDCDILSRIETSRGRARSLSPTLYVPVLFSSYMIMIAPTSNRSDNSFL